MACRLVSSGSLLAAIFCLLSCTALYPPAPYLPSRQSITPGETITVDGRKNIYAVAHDHNVSMRDIIVLNNLQAPYVLKAGQRLTLPAGGSGGSSGMGFGGTSPVAPAPVSAASGAVESMPLAPIEPAPVQPAPVAKAPPLVPPPNAQNAPSAPSTSAPLAPHASTVSPVDALNAPRPQSKPVATTASSQTSEQPASPAPLPPAEIKPPSTPMIWPVRGPILSAFGPKGQGLNNDGINIGAPNGAPVVAAAPGTVVYAGNEMKGFGNLILIRHQGGWVTAYAHLGRMLVKKDDIVTQGDMIGSIGKTGNVSSPQLHFETRYEGKPVDPDGVIKAP